MADTERKFSELPTAATLTDADILALSQVDSGSETLMSKKTTLLAIANKVASGTNYTSELQTISKTLIGAINEAAQSGGSDVEVTPILSEGTKLATITVDDTTADIYGENTKEEIKQMKTPKTVTGNPVTFETVEETFAKGAELTFGPIQDLHGYDHPWPGGAGKNKLPFDLDAIKALNTDGSWSGNVYTFNGISFTVNTDGTVTANGTATTNSTLYLVNPYTASFDCILNGCPENGSASTYQIAVTGVGQDRGSGLNISSGQSGTLYMRVFANYTANNLTFKPMIRLSTETDATFAPYENICPISGRDSASLTVAGKNRSDNPTATSLANGNLNLTNNGTFGSVEKGKIYTFSFDVLETNAAQVQLRLNNISNSLKIWNAGALVGETRAIFTFTASDDGTVNFWATTNAFTPNKKVFDNIQLEDGNTATAYEPYIAPRTTTQSFSSTEYGATGSIKDGDLERKMIKAIISNFNLFTYQSTTNFKAAYVNFNTLSLPKISTEEGKASLSISDKFKQVDVGTRQPYGTFSTYTTGNGILYLWDNDNHWGSKEAFVEEMTELGSIELCYELATPETITGTAHDILLNAGTNNVSTDADTAAVTYTEMTTLDDMRTLINAAQTA